MRQPRKQFCAPDPQLEIAGAQLAHLLHYWRSKGGGDRIPARADIDPVELGRHLGHLYMIDVLSSPPCFRYRLVGVDIALAIGADPTGLFVDEAMGCEALPDDRETLEWIVAEAAPLRLSGRTRLPARAAVDFEALKLPLASDGKHVDMILCSVRFEESTEPLSKRIPSFVLAAGTIG